MSRLAFFSLDKRSAADNETVAMRIFDRYIARQLLVSTLLAVVVLSVVLVMGQIFKKLLDLLVEGVIAPPVIFKFMACAFGASLSYTLPWGLLTAVLLTFGRLSADNELMTMRMAGLSLRRICLPVFVVAGGCSALCFWVNTSVAPLALKAIDQMTKQAVMRDPRVIFAPDKVLDEKIIPGHLMYVGDRQGDELKNVQIIQLDPGGEKERSGRPSGMIFAKEGRLVTEGMVQRQAIEFGSRGNTYFVRNELAPLTKEERGNLTPEAVAARESAMAAEASMPPRIFDFGTRVSDIPISLKAILEKSARVRVNVLSMAELRQHMASPGARQREHPGIQIPGESEMRVEFHRRISFSFACLVLALAGIPFGIAAQRRETSSGFVLSLAVGIGYFSLIMLGGMWSRQPEFAPHLWIWLPNVVFGIMGIILFRRMQRK